MERDRHNEISRKSYAKNIDRIKANLKLLRQTPEYRERNKVNQKKYKDNNKEKFRMRWAKWSKSHPEEVRFAKLKSEYGISKDEYNQLFVNQNGVCAICSNKEKLGTMLCVDHDHETGKYRGLLCKKCNLAIGFFNDNSNLVLNALSYLKKYGK